MLLSSSLSHVFCCTETSAVSTVCKLCRLCNQHSCRLCCMVDRSHDIIVLTASEHDSSQSQPGNLLAATLPNDRHYSRGVTSPTLLTFSHRHGNSLCLFRPFPPCSTTGSHTDQVQVLPQIRSIMQEPLPYHSLQAQHPRCQQARLCSMLVHVSQSKQCAICQLLSTYLTLTRCYAQEAHLCCSVDGKGASPL